MKKRTCPRCGLSKPPKDWYKWKGSYCKECSREIVRKRLYENYKARLAIVNTFKDKPCADCGVSYPPCVMDFDHVRGKKSKAVSLLIGACAPMKRIIEEIEKCEVVCANCHRLRTASRKERVY